MKKWFSVFVLAFLIISLAACNSDEVQTVRVAEVTHSIFYAPLYVALEQGYFEEEGLNVELTLTPGGDKVMTALLSDGADIGLVGSETSIYVAAQGSTDPVINFAHAMQNIIQGNFYN